MSRVDLSPNSDFKNLLKFIVFLFLLLTKWSFLHLFITNWVQSYSKFSKYLVKTRKKERKTKEFILFSSEQRFCTACIGSPDADGFRKGGGYPVSGDGALDVLSLKVSAVEYDGEGYC